MISPNIQLNDDKYFREIVIGRMKDDTTNTVFDKLVVPDDSVHNMTLTTDVAEPYPTLTITVADPDGGKSVPKYQPDGYSVIQLTFSYYDTSSNKPYTMQHRFVITNCEIVSRTNEEAIFLLTAVTFYYPILNARVAYADQNDTSCTRHIQSLLKTVGLPVAAPAGFNHSSRKMPFTSTANDTVMANVNFLLKHSNTADTGIYWLCFNMLDNQYSVVSLKDLFKSKPLYFNATTVGTKHGFSSMEALSDAERTNNYIGGVEMYDFASQTTVHNFDYATRTWNPNVYPTKRIRQFFPRSPDLQDRIVDHLVVNVPSSYTRKGAKFEIQRANTTEQMLGDRVDKVLRYGDVLQLDVRGFIARDVGQLFVVSASRDDDANFKKFSGVYAITRVYSTWTRGIYNQNLSLVRVQKPSYYLQSGSIGAN